MTAKQLELRKKAATMFHDAMEIVEKIEPSGWEIPARYIKDNLHRWSEMYGYVEAKKCRDENEKEHKMKGMDYFTVGAIAACMIVWGVILWYAHWKEGE